MGSRSVSDGPILTGVNHSYSQNPCIIMWHRLREKAIELSVLKCMNVQWKVMTEEKFNLNEI